MKHNPVCFVLFLLLLTQPAKLDVPYILQPSLQPTTSSSYTPPNILLPPPNTGNTFITNTDSPVNPDNSQSPLDLNSDSEARMTAMPVNSDLYQDQKAIRRAIGERAANIPGENQSMDQIYKAILEHVNQINCKHNKEQSKSAESEFVESLLNSAAASSVDQYSLCDKDIAPVVFMPLSNMHTTRTSLYNHFRDNIYRPLGYEFPSQRFSYTDTISDLINLDQENSMIHKDTQGLNFANFSNIINQAFHSIEVSATDFDHNKGAISRQMIDILKSFHIFWNVLRQNKKISQTKSQTLSIIKNLMYQFKSTNGAMKATTLNILQNVKEAYFRFMRAHKYQQLISSKPLETICFQLLERYKQNVVKIRNRATDGYEYVSEISIFLDMLKAFHAVNLRNRLTTEESLKMFDLKIGDVITTTYNVFQDVMVQNNDDSFFKVRDFTAVLLLKMRHRNYVMLTYYGLDEYMRLQKTGGYQVFENAVKFYEEIIDSIMLIPTACQSLINSSLEKCVKEQLDTILNTYSKKYMLQASIGGVNLFRFVQQGLDDVFNALVADALSHDFIPFKSKFVSRMSGFFKTFRSQYRINDMSDVEELENNIGFQIEKVKSANALLPVNLALIDSFDKQLYNFFLDIKSSYNAYAPVSKDQRVLNSIVQKLKTVILNFKQDNARHICDETNQLFEIVYRESKVWTRRHSVQYVVNTHKVNLRFEKNNQPVDAPLNRANVNDVMLDLPMVNSNWHPSMANQAAHYAGEMNNFNDGPE